MRSLLAYFFVLPVFTSIAQTLDRSKVIVIAHRGDHSDAPENTLKAFEDAIKNGANYIEVDLRSTSDHKLVILHDRTVDRVTNGHGDIKSLTYAEVQKLVVSNRTHPEFGQHKIPTFEEVLTLAKGKINIYLDFKDADIPTTVDLIKSSGMEKNVVVYINSDEQYSAWRKSAPDFPLIISLPDSVADESTLRQFLNTVDAEILDGDAGQYNIPMITLAKTMRRRIWVDVQSADEGPKIWETALSKGVEGLQTDHLRALKDWLKK